MNNSNYPDDIRRFDNDPRSPFYVEPIINCRECGHAIEEDCGIEIISEWYHDECWEKIKEDYES
jgi:hypothetical protein